MTEWEKFLKVAGKGEIHADAIQMADGRWGPSCIVRVDFDGETLEHKLLERGPYFATENEARAEAGRQGREFVELHYPPKPG